MVITDEMARYLIRAVCCLLTLLFAIGAIGAGVRKWRCPFGRRVQKQVPVLYYLKAGGKQYPVVDIGTAEKTCPVTVQTPCNKAETKIGTQINICYAENEPHNVIAADETPFRRFAAGLIGAGTAVAVAAIIGMLPAIKAVLIAFGAVV